MLLFPVVATSLDGSPANITPSSTPAWQITTKKISSCSIFGLYAIYTDPGLEETLSGSVYIVK